MEASPAWRASSPGGAASVGYGGQPAADRAEHIPDAEIHWPSIDGGPYAGQVWAIEVELTPKWPGGPRGSWPGCWRRCSNPVVYLTAARARPVVARAAGSLPPGEQSRVVVRDLPGYAFASVGSLPVSRCGASRSR